MGKLIKIGDTQATVRFYHAKWSPLYFYENFIKDSDTVIETVGTMHHRNLLDKLNELKMNDIKGKEHAVVQNLKNLGFTIKED